jgi:HlyD family secretion protein
MRTIAIVGILAVLGAGAYFGNSYFRGSETPEVNVEPIRQRDLKALVSASGTIQPQLSVDISASVMGRVTRLSVNEGDQVTAGQFLLQIDPESLQTAVDRGEASLRAAESSRNQAQVSVMSAEVNLEVARDNLERQQELWELKLVSREAFDQAVSDVQLRETEVEARRVEVATAEQRMRQEEAMLSSARYDLSLVTIVSPIDGIVTRRSIEEGETVMVGTMNNPGTVLMTIADFSVLEAELEVDETDIPDVQFGQETEITIDALPGVSYRGRVTEIGNSPIQDTQQGGSQATNFKIVVTLDDDIPEVRPGFTCTADITTALRAAAIAIPIQATTVREMPVDAEGKIVRPARTGDSRGVTPSVSAASTDLGDMARLEEIEGVFIVQDGRVRFTPVVTGIAGERYFEAVAGLSEGDPVVTGPFNVVRTLSDGDLVRTQRERGSESDTSRSFIQIRTRTSE